MTSELPTSHEIPAEPVPRAGPGVAFAATDIRQALGLLGERVAARWLMARGWTVVAHRFRSGHRDLDLVVRQGSLVAFVEVKARRATGYGGPLGALHWRKRRELVRSAQVWMARHGAATRRIDSTSWGYCSSRRRAVGGGVRTGSGSLRRALPGAASGARAARGGCLPGAVGILIFDPILRILFGFVGESTSRRRPGAAGADRLRWPQRVHD
jgi:putative endonuclease